MEGEPDYAIDATTHGNISRFINHRWVLKTKLHVNLPKLLHCIITHRWLMLSVIKISSCSANLVTHQVIVKSMESPLAHIGLYASIDVRLFFSFSWKRCQELVTKSIFFLVCVKQIAAGEEITRDYGCRPVTSGQENEHPCHCKAINCRGRFC